MAERFKLKQHECPHERCTRVEDTTVVDSEPHFQIWCADCGEDQTALPAFLRARAEEAKVQANEAIEERRQVSIKGEEPDYAPPTAWPDLGTPACLVGPEFVLRESVAKIALIDEYEDLLTTGDRTEQRVTLRFTLEHLAAVYRDHEDYRPEWAPYEEQP